MQKGKVNVYLKASLCSANVSFPSLRIRRKNERVSSARHSPKSSAYGGYFNFLIPSFLWVASLNTHTRTRSHPSLSFSFSPTPSLPPRSLTFYFDSLSRTNTHAHTECKCHCIYGSGRVRERERNECEVATRKTEEEWGGAWARTKLIFCFLRGGKKKKKGKLCKKQHEVMEIWVCISYC